MYAALSALISIQKRIQTATNFLTNQIFFYTCFPNRLIKRPNFAKHPIILLDLMSIK